MAAVDEDRIQKILRRKICGKFVSLKSLWKRPSRGLNLNIRQQNLSTGERTFVAAVMWPSTSEISTQRFDPTKHLCPTVPRSERNIRNNRTTRTSIIERNTPVTPVTPIIGRNDATAVSPSTPTMTTSNIHQRLHFTIHQQHSGQSSRQLSGQYSRLSLHHTPFADELPDMHTDDPGMPTDHPGMPSGVHISREHLRAVGTRLGEIGDSLNHRDGPVELFGQMFGVGVNGRTLRDCLRNGLVCVQCSLTLLMGVMVVKRLVTQS